MRTFLAKEQFGMFDGKCHIFMSRGRIDLALKHAS
jgi:hypothetical protein